MNRHAPHPDLVRLAAIEQRWLASRDVKYVTGFGPEHLAAGADVIVEFGDAATADERQFYFYAYPDIKFLLDFAGRAIRSARQRAQQQMDRQPARQQQEPKDFAAECAMKCQAQGFRIFLQDRHGLPADPSDDDIKACLYEALQISSRKDLNTNPEAAHRWKDMRSAFEAWSKVG